MFTYEELFSLFQGRIYFLINFKDGNYTDWKMRDIFLRKYLTTFNYDAKTISFYRSQIDEINRKSKVPDYNKNKDDDSSSKVEVNLGKIIRIIIEISMGIIIIVISVLLYKKYKSSRKKRANELNDDEDYDYTPKEKKEPILAENNSDHLMIN